VRDVDDEDIERWVGVERLNGRDDLAKPIVGQAKAADFVDPEALPAESRPAKPSPRTIARAARVKSTARVSGEARTLGELNFRSVTKHEAKCVGQLLGPSDDHFFTNQAVLDLGRDIQDLAVLENDRVFQLAVANLAAVIDGREGPM